MLLLYEIGTIFNKWTTFWAVPFDDSIGNGVDAAGDVAEAKARLGRFRILIRIPSIRAPHYEVQLPTFGQRERLDQPFEFLWVDPVESIMFCT